MKEATWTELWNKMRGHWPAHKGAEDGPKIKAFFERLRGFSDREIQSAVATYIDEGKGFPNVSELLTRVPKKKSANEARHALPHDDRFENMTTLQHSEYYRSLEPKFYEFKRAQEEAHTPFGKVVWHTLRRMLLINAESCAQEYHKKLEAAKEEVPF